MQNRASHERGDTLIEVLLALIILGITGVALLTAFATAITASSEHRNLATLDSSVRAASDQVISQVQQSGNNAFGPSNCTNNPGDELHTDLEPDRIIHRQPITPSHTGTGRSFVSAPALTNVQGL